MKTSTILLITLMVAIIIVIVLFPIVFDIKEPISVNSFEECALAGNNVLESYPQQCLADGETFTEDIGNELEKTDLIRVDSPRPNQEVASPLTVQGEARGYWFFEADFSVVLLDADGVIIAQGIAQAQGEWMTADFVPFALYVLFSNYL